MRCLDRRICARLLNFSGDSATRLLLATGRAARTSGGSHFAVTAHHLLRGSYVDCSRDSARITGLYIEPLTRLKRPYDTMIPDAHLRIDMCACHWPSSFMNDHNAPSQSRTLYSR